MLSRWWVRAVASGAAGLAACSGAMLAAAPARADVARSSQQWVLNELQLPAAWGQTEGHGVTVAVIDSGVNPSVPDLSGSVITGPDFTGVNTPPSDPNWGVHGTWMAALVAGHGHSGGQGPFGAGILGSAPRAKVLSIRVITDAQDPNDAKYQAQSSARGQGELADAITYAVNHKASVISMSLGYSLQSRAVRVALQDAYDHNVVVVASAGNSGNSANSRSAPGATSPGQAPFSFPADYPGVLSVAAVNQSGQVAGFSSDNLSVQVAAPGNLVPTQGRDGQYWYVSGTSPACALTAGVAALIKSKYPGLTDAQVISAITSSTTLSTRPPGGWDEQIGFGVVNARRALTTAGKIAAAGHPAEGMAVSTHFGGGQAAVPPVPVAPRGAGVLIGFGLLGFGCLALIAMATSRLLTPAPAGSARVRSSRSRRGAPGYPPGYPSGMPGGMPMGEMPPRGVPSPGAPPPGPGGGWSGAGGWPPPQPAGQGDGWPAPRPAGPGGGWPAPPPAGPAGSAGGWPAPPPRDPSGWPTPPPGASPSVRHNGPPHAPQHHAPEHAAPEHHSPHAPQHHSPRGHEGVWPDDRDQSPG